MARPKEELLGADGAPAIEEERDEEVLERGRAVMALVGDRTYLGREFLTWLLWRSNDGGPICDVDGEAVKLLFVGPVSLRGVAEEATELQVKGHLSAYAQVTRTALARGLLVHAGQIRIEHGEQHFELGLDASFLDVRSAKVPALLTKEEDERVSERLWLADRVASFVDALFEAFMTVRKSRAWTQKTVPAMRRWFTEEG